jgi:hypothetical protein
MLGMVVAFMAFWRAVREWSGSSDDGSEVVFITDQQGRGAAGRLKKITVIAGSLSSSFW